jgi:hypothetical protein
MPLMSAAFLFMLKTELKAMLQTVLQAVLQAE